MRLNRLEEAGHWYRESLRTKPDHIPAHLTYGKLLSIIVRPILHTHAYTGRATMQAKMFSDCSG